MSSKKRPETAASQFKASLALLLKLLVSKEPSYIRCIKPNDFKLANNFDINVVAHQVWTINDCFFTFNHFMTCYLIIIFFNPPPLPIIGEIFRLNGELAREESRICVSATLRTIYKSLQEFVSGNVAFSKRHTQRGRTDTRQSFKRSWIHIEIVYSSSHGDDLAMNLVRSGWLSDGSHKNFHTFP